MIRPLGVLLVAALQVTAGCEDAEEPPAPLPVTAYPALKQSLCAALPFDEEARRFGLRRVGKVGERWHPIRDDGSGTSCQVDFLPTEIELPNLDDRWRLDLSVVVADNWNLDPFRPSTRPGVEARAEVQGWWGEGYSYQHPRYVPGYDKPLLQVAGRIVTHHNLTADISVYAGRGDPEVLARLGELIIDDLHPALPAPVIRTPRDPDAAAPVMGAT